MKDKNIKIYAFYLPQFHETQENNIWWGKGFTEWDNVKNSKPLFLNHNQPRVMRGDDSIYGSGELRTLSGMR